MRWQPSSRAIALAAIVVAACVYLVRLGEPAWTPQGQQIELFDERYTAFTAHRIAMDDRVAYERAPRRFEYAPETSDDISLAERIEWSHPPGAPLAIAAMIELGDYSAWWVRLVSVVSAVIALLVVRRLAEPGDEWCACVVVAFDGMFFVFARTAMPQMILTAALAGAVACVVAVVRQPRRAWLLALGAGACFGFAASIRWTALPVMVAVMAAAAVSREGRAHPLRRRLVWLGAIVAAAAVVYLATFIPYLAHGHSLGDLARLHAAMWWFHTHLPGDYAQASSAVDWPLQLRALRLGGGRVDGEPWLVLALGNRLVWWLAVPALIAGGWRARHRSIAELVPVAAVAALWLPWVVLGRFGFAYYLVPALPFVGILVARWLRAVPRARLALAIAAVCVFVASYPVIAAVPISERTANVYLQIFGAAR